VGNLKFREYEYILTIASEQNLTRASERLYVSQPALSRLLQNVEYDVGTPLFERRGRQMYLTSAGKIYVESAREIVDLDNRMKKMIQNLDRQNDELSICYPLLRSEFLVKSVFPIFRENHKSIPNMASIVSQRGIQDVLQNGKARLALGVVTPMYEQKFAFEEIAQEEMVLVIPVGHPLLEKAESREDCNYPYIEANYLREQHFVLPAEGSYSGGFAELYFADHNINPNVAMRLNFTGCLYQYVINNYGIAILPSIPPKSMGLEGMVEYLSLQDKSFAHIVGLIHNKNILLNKFENSLLDIIREVYI
jgi:DNA-binding transcriptional LysR family regulator